MFGWFRRSNPEEQEQARCALLKKSGRRVEGLVTEVTEKTVFYQYEIRGVTYQAAQDFRLMKCAFPEDSGELLGPVTVQYATKNPANSMVVIDESRVTQ